MTMPSTMDEMVALCKEGDVLVLECKPMHILGPDHLYLEGYDDDTGAAADLMLVMHHPSDGRKPYLELLYRDPKEAEVVVYGRAFISRAPFYDFEELRSFAYTL